MYINGCVVKETAPKSENYYTQSHKNYFGISSYISWPLLYTDQFLYLDNQVDDMSIIAEKGYFFDKKYKIKNHARSLRIVSDGNFIKNYVRICNEQKIETLIMMVETEIPIVSNIACRLISTLGYDCIGNDYYSMLFDLFENQNLFEGMYNKLNKNFLFDSLTDAKEFLSVRDKLISDGIDFEREFEPIPARLSIIRMNY